MDSDEDINRPPELRLAPETTCGREQRIDTGRPERKAQTQEPLDPFDNDQGIEYWLWNGVRLVPAWPDEIARIREQERAREGEFQAELEQQRAGRRRHLLHPVSALGALIEHAWTPYTRFLRFRVVSWIYRVSRDGRKAPPHTEG